MFLKINRSVKTPLHRPSIELLALGYKLLTIWKICKYLSVQRCRINSTLISYEFLVVKQIKDSLIFMAVVTFSSTVKTVEWVEPTVQRGVRPTKEAKVTFANNVRRISWNEKIIYRINWLAWDHWKQLKFCDVTGGFLAKWRRAEIPFWWRVTTLTRSGWCLWLVEANFSPDTTNQKCYPDPGFETSSVWNFCARFSDVISREIKWWRGEISAFFSG